MDRPSWFLLKKVPQTKFPNTGIFGFVSWESGRSLKNPRERIVMRKNKKIESVQVEKDRSVVKVDMNTPVENVIEYLKKLKSSNIQYAKIELS
jgi:hypothetical protein